MGGFEIQRLGRDASLRDFDCGEPALNEYLHRYAQRSQASHIAVTYVARRGERTLGYVTLAASQVTGSQR
ncbi:MAG: hypothetical protein ACYC2X_10360 [Coriobacteriia bacterium]